MEKIIHLKFHHQGEFQSTRYAGGTETVICGVNSDLFSFTVLMEYVKDDLKYSVIGGIYVMGENSGDWKLVTNDLDLKRVVDQSKSDDHIDFYIDNLIDMSVHPIEKMQPHVVIRPRPNLVAAKKPPKRFTTGHQLQQQKTIKAKQMGSVKWPQEGTRKSPRLNKLGKCNDTPVTCKPTTVKRNLWPQSRPHENETMGENEVESERTILPPPPTLTDYEKQRLVRIEYNKEVLYTILPSLSEKVKNSGPKSNSNEKARDGSDDYDPRQDAGHDANSDGDASVTPPKGTKKTNKKKLITGRVPTTRSRANSTAKAANEATREKDETCQVVEPIISPLPVISPLPDDGQGSMAAWRAMRKRQREQSEKKKAEQEKVEQEKAGASPSKKVVEENFLPDIEEGDMEDPVPKKMRGKTRMDAVHMRSFDKRVAIGMNDDFQAIAENGKVLSELSSYLGTLAKRRVSLTYVTWRHVPKSLKETMWNLVKARYIIPDELKKWALETIHSSWKSNKSRVKEAHFTKYENDEMRLANKPDDIPLETFKLLLEYWNDDSVQERARKNAESRKAYVDTHTLGPKSFAQHRYKMKKVDDELEPCDAEVFVETRKRVEGRMYKTNPEIITKKIDTITKKLTTGDAAFDDELGAKHGPNWLKGRCVRSGMCSSNAPTGTYVKDLTAKIKEGLASELEEKLKKVEAGVEQKMQLKLALALKKLGEANPDIKIDFEELCEIFTTETDDDGTPITRGSSF